jgi:hypothetical protein
VVLLAWPVDRCYNSGMKIFRGKPLSEWGIILELHPKDRRGRTGRHHMIRVFPGKGATPGIGLSIQDQSMLAGANLDEEELGLLIKGLQDALEASRAIAARREGEEASQGG